MLSIYTSSADASDPVCLAGNLASLRSAVPYFPFSCSLYYFVLTQMPAELACSPWGTEQAPSYMCCGVPRVADLARVPYLASEVGLSR